jgi:hypothetical protein
MDGRAARPHVMSPLIQPDDPDFIGQVPKKVVVPASWQRRMERAARELRCSERSLTVQMVRASMARPERAPIPEGPELVGVPQDNRFLAPRRWKALAGEAKARGLSMNKVFQAHFLRGLEMAEEQVREEKGKD